MLWSIAADERSALHFDDLASAFDAGLPLHNLGGDAKAGDRVLHDILKQRGVVLSTTEDAVLLAGWRAGRAGAALRSRSVGRRKLRGSQALLRERDDLPAVTGAGAHEQSGTAG